MAKGKSGRYALAIYVESRYTTDTAELWLDSQHTRGSVWRVVAI